MAMVQLDLFEDVVHLPWHGRSPRSLTRCAMALFLRREPQKDERFFVDPEQLLMWPPVRKGPRSFAPGVPLLLEPRRARCRYQNTRWIVPKSRKIVVKDRNPDGACEEVWVERSPKTH